MPSSSDRFVNEAILVGRLVLCGGIVGASSAGLLTHYETVSTDGFGALVGAAVVLALKLAHFV